MSIDWENILPEKWSTDEPHCDAFNRCRYESLNALKAAETRGEICKPLSVEDVINIACKFCKEPCDDIKARCWDKAREVHNAMLGKERK